MTETTSGNAYGCDDSMDGVYNILKLTVSDKNDHMQIPNNSSTPLEIQNMTNVKEDTSQMASSVSNLAKTKNHESKLSIHREKKKHKKELLRALDEFKQESTRDRKKLSRLECCENYRVVGNSCEECWPGTYGVDCKDNCPPNFYGKSCSKECGCQACDRVTGCSNATVFIYPHREEYVQMQADPWNAVQTIVSLETPVKTTDAY
uniref:Uncharacterized protein n=1 Tax=Magallana gigas TaxID=29159 RepID=K1QDC5_MAGGI